METKEELVKTINYWIEIDNQIKEFQKNIKVLKNDQKKITDLLIDTMKKNELDCVNISDNSLLLKYDKQKQTINKKYLHSCLLEFCQDESKAEELSEFILSKRKEKIVEKIKRKPI